MPVRKRFGTALFVDNSNLDLKEKTMAENYRGSCLCGTVVFEVDKFLPLAGHCHCSMCRKFHGAAYATIAEVSSSDFRWTAGTAALKGYTAENGTTRTFCYHCGTSLTFSSPRVPDDVVEIALATFDDNVPVEPNAHIFVGSAANWTKITDDLPQYLEGRDGPRK